MREILTRRLSRSVSNVVGLVLLAASVGCTEPPQSRLSSAILRGDIKTVESLVDDPNVDINWHSAKGTTALGDAAAYSQPNQAALVRLLLRKGADPNIAPDENMTPLHSAAYHGYADVVRQLIEAGANVNASETRYGFVPLGYAARNGHVEVIKLLLDAGANQTATKDGRSPAQIARQYGHIDAADVLMFYRQNAYVVH